MVINGVKKNYGVRTLAATNTYVTLPSQLVQCVYHRSDAILAVPRKEYKTITVKIETFRKFMKAAKEAKKVHHRMYYTEFLELLLDVYKKSKL